MNINNIEEEFWLTYVSYEEDDFKEMNIYLEKEIMKFYNKYLKEDKKE